MEGARLLVDSIEAVIEELLPQLSDFTGANGTILQPAAEAIEDESIDVKNTLVLVRNADKLQLDALLITSKLNVQSHA
jgi:hypothetical protein